MLLSYFLPCFLTQPLRKICGRCNIEGQDAWRRSIEAALRDSKYFSLQTDETTDLTVTQQMAIMLRFFDNSHGTVWYVFFKLEGVTRATAEQLYQVIDKHFQGSDIIWWV